MAGFRTEYEQKKWDSIEAEQNFPFKKMLSGIATPEDLKRAQTLLAKYNKLASDVFNMGLQAMQKVATDKVGKISARASRSGRPLGRVALENLYTRVLQREQAKQLPEIAKSVQAILDEHQNQFKSFMEKVLPAADKRKDVEETTQKLAKDLPELLRKDVKDEIVNPLQKINDSILQSTKDLVNRSKELEHAIGSDLGLKESGADTSLSSIDNTKIDSIVLTEKDSDRVAALLEGMKQRQAAFYSVLEQSALSKSQRDEMEAQRKIAERVEKANEKRLKEEEKEKKENSIAARFKRMRDRYDKAKRGVGTVGKFLRGLSLLMMRGLVGVGAMLLANEFGPQLKKIFDPDNIVNVGKTLMDFSVKGVTKLKDEIIPNFGSWVSETFTKLWPVVKQGASEIYQVLRTNQDGSLNLLGRLDALAGADISKEAKLQGMTKEIAISLGLAAPRRGVYEIDQERDAAMTKIANIENYKKAIREGRRHEVDPSTLGIPGLTKNSLPNMQGLNQEIKRTQGILEDLNKERHLSEITSASGPSRLPGATITPVVNTNSDTFNITGSPNISGFKTAPNTRAQEDLAPITDIPSTPKDGSPIVDPGFQLPRTPAAVSETASISGTNIPAWPAPELALVNISAIG